jgi:xanthine dehydrogenase accessory factor
LNLGGGKVEYQSIVLVQELLDRKKSQSKAFMLRPNEVEDLGMICGGDVETYLQFIQGRDEAVMSLMGECLAGLEKNEALWLFTDFTNEAAWSMSLYRQGDSSQAFSAEALKGLTKTYALITDVEGRRIYSEPIHFAEKAVIFGGGHVAQELAPVLSRVGFRCVVFEDRKDFLNRDLFPTAFDLVLGDFNKIGDAITLNPHDYVVVVTRGHVFDAISEKHAIEQNCTYIGVIGSKTKVASVRQRLMAQGISQAALDKVYSPIGIDIDAETPEEIAISIAAEMIRHRAGLRAKV